VSDLSESSVAAAATRLPAEVGDCVLVVDLDGTLTPTDTLIESTLLLIKQRPLAVPGLLPALLGGRSSLKAYICDRVALDPANLPWRADFIAFLHAERARGRRIVLATAADRRIAERVAAHLGLFDEVLASDRDLNLKGPTKLAALRERFGERFVYCGDSAADLAVWEGSAGAVLVGTTPALQARVRARSETPTLATFGPDGGGSLRLWAKAMRVHQWVKNVLIFLPLLTAFAFTSLVPVLEALAAFIAFSLAASATYIGNDLWDLESDRAHRSKKNRPFASGALMPHHGVAVAAVLMGVGLGIAALLSLPFLAMLVGYVVVTTAYSWSLKRYVVLDVITLAVLYTWRVLAGAIAIEVTISTWLLAFSVFLFASLALIKRCAELVALQHEGKTGTRGRNYEVGDLVVLWPLGIGAGLSSVVVFGLFIGAPDTIGRYADARLLWLVAIGLMYWLSRLWIKTARGVMHDDPIVFALRDRGSRLTILGMVAVTVAAWWLK